MYDRIARQKWIESKLNSFVFYECEVVEKFSHC